VGRLEHEKGMDLLLRAFARLVRVQKESSLRIVGAGPQQEQLRSLCRDLDLEGSVHFLGKLEPSALLEEYRRASLFALASRFEAFGVVFIEAMACGLPVVATRAGGPETFIPESAGKVVDKEDVDALYAALQYVGKHRAAYDPVQIRKYALDHFSQEAVAARYTKLIKSLKDD
jgi:glycosyltransferase involved in cell wall biosynthesis